MIEIPSEVILETLLFLKRYDIEDKQLICKRWNTAISRNISLLPCRVLKSIEICSLDIGGTKDDNVKYAVIDSPTARNKVWLKDSFPEDAKILISLKEYVIKQLILDGVSYETMYFLKRLKFLMGSKLQAIEYQSIGWYTCNAVILDSYISTCQAHLSLNVHEMKTLFRPTMPFRQLPESVQSVRLTFTQFYESSYDEEFIGFLNRNPLTQANRCEIHLKGDFRLCYFSRERLCDQILQAYENSKTPQNMIKKIVFDDLRTTCINRSFMTSRNFSLNDLTENDFNTSELYEVDLNQGCKMSLLFEQVFEGETSYKVVFEVKEC